MDKREQEELFKRTKTGEDVEKPYAEGERIEGLGFAPYVSNFGFLKWLGEGP